VWAQSHGYAVGQERALQLLTRYGTRATAIIDFIGSFPEKMLTHSPTFSDKEIEFLVKNESVYRLEDLVHRRTNLAFTGSMNTAVLKELAEIVASVLHWDTFTSSAEVSGVHLEIGSKA